MQIHRLLLSVFLLAALPFLSAADAPAAKPMINKSRAGLALQGYDPVAYFAAGQPAKGDPAITAAHEDATYRFASAAHRDLFVADPAKYVPAYGGYCGYAAAIGKVRPVKPTLWSIVDGQLVLQHSKGAAALWAKDVPGNKTKADRYWPLLVAAKAGVENPVDPLFGKSVLPELR